MVPLRNRLSRTPVSRLPPANRKSGYQILLPHGIVEEAGHLLLGEVKGLRKASNWRLYTLGMAHHGVRMRIFKVLWLSAPAIENINRRLEDLEVAKGVAEGAVEEKTESELRVC